MKASVQHKAVNHTFTYINIIAYKNYHIFSYNIITFFDFYYLSRIRIYIETNIQYCNQIINKMVEKVDIKKLKGTRNLLQTFL